METMKITSVEQLKAYAQGEVVELPPFANGQPFVARLKRPSLMSLVKNGKIPNSLITTANKLFVNDATAVAPDNDDALAEVFDLMDVICEASIIEPRYKDIISAGVELTDEQLMFVFNYTQVGVKALDNFR